jgi:hypothetical protein
LVESSNATELPAPSGKVYRLRHGNHDCFLLNRTNDASPLRRHSLSNEGPTPDPPVVRGEEEFLSCEPATKKAYPRHSVLHGKPPSAVSFLHGRS